MNDKPIRNITSFRLDAPTIKALEYMATKERRTTRQIVELAVEEYFLAHHSAELEKKLVGDINTKSPP